MVIRTAGGAWVAQLANPLPSAQVEIPGSWDGAHHPPTVDQWGVCFSLPVCLSPPLAISNKILKIIKIKIIKIKHFTGTHLHVSKSRSNRTKRNQQFPVPDSQCWDQSRRHYLLTIATQPTHTPQKVHHPLRAALSSQQTLCDGEEGNQVLETGVEPLCPGTPEAELCPTSFSPVL